MEPSSTTTEHPGEPMPTCDCGAHPDEVAAGIHYPGCTSHDGPTDDPSDHYEYRPRRAVMTSRPRKNIPAPFGCSWCGEQQRHHGRRWSPIIGMHAWRQPTQQQIKERMLLRLDARLNAEPPKYHATTGWAADHTGESADPYCADCKTDGCRRWMRIQDKLDRARWGIAYRSKHSRHAKTGGFGGGWGGNEPF